MDWGGIFGQIATDLTTTIGAVVLAGIPVLVALIGIGVALRVFGKFGARR